MRDPRLKTRRRRRGAVGAIWGVVLSRVVLDHAGAMRYPGNDFARFDRAIVRMVEVESGDVFLAKDERGEVISIRLIDAVAPQTPADEATASRDYLQARLNNRDVILKLDGTRTRDSAGCLLAYVYVTDADCLNIDCVRDGRAFAERRERHAFTSTATQIENEARKKQRGLWKNLTGITMPPWRLNWLQSLRKK